MNRSNRRQPRSNSISGQEFHHLGGEYHALRPKQTVHTPHSPFVDSNQYYSQKMRDYVPSQYNHNLTADRSLSPLSLNGGRPSDFYVPKRSSSIKYQAFEKQSLTRSQVHASLECLKTMYSDYGNQPNQKQPSVSNHHVRHYPQVHYQQQQQPLQHHTTLQNNNYATTYVLTAAPPDTVVSHNAEQDLAAAAMATPQHYNPMLSSGSNSISKMNSVNQSPQAQNHYNAQGSFAQVNRTMAPVSQSPLHRRLVNGPMAGILNQITSSTSNPLRAGHSSLSLASSAYLIEDKLQNEIKQLQSELNSEKEKNEALSSQLNINSNLMAAFEQSLTTLNSRLRQMTNMVEQKDKEIDFLRNQLNSSDRLAVRPVCDTSEKSTSPIHNQLNGNNQHHDITITSESIKKNDMISQQSNERSDVNEQTTRNSDEKNLLKVIEDLKKQLIEKERLLTDTRLEALSAAHQLEQLESRMNGEKGCMVNEDDLDEGVMVVNHSPSDSDAITDSAHFSDQHNLHRLDYEHTNHNVRQQDQQKRTNQVPQRDNNLHDMILFTPTHEQNTSSEGQTGGFSSNSTHSNDDTNEILNINFHRQQQQQDNHSDQSSSDYREEEKSRGDTTNQQEFSTNDTNGDAFESHDGKSMNNLLEKLLVSN
jgi:hypothetical protein